MTYDGLVMDLSRLDAFFDVVVMPCEEERFQVAKAERQQDLRNSGLINTLGLNERSSEITEHPVFSTSLPSLCHVNLRHNGGALLHSPLEHIP